MKYTKLFQAKERAYGKQYRDHLLEQYKLYIDSAEKVSDRRQHANNYFITINTALVTFIGLSFQIKLFGSVPWARALLAFVGLIICTIFWYLLRSYKQLNAGKFKVIHKIEEKLPLALFDYEWKILEEGKNRKVYYPFSHIELYIPWVFGLIYFFLGFIFILPVLPLR